MVNHRRTRASHTHLLWTNAEKEKRNWKVSLTKAVTCCCQINKKKIKIYFSPAGENGKLTAVQIFHFPRPKIEMMKKVHKLNLHFNYSWFSSYMPAGLD